ncbi:MAG: ferrous iron transport protein A [Firmicutes bacterium]|nr:ferrous iron transport protein A [Bacillota bacterium]MCL2256004.1 ferrous iron transport protein A [Bacillota bacterium]
MTLSNAKLNTAYSIKKLHGEFNEKRRLLDMGFSPESQIVICAIAPFGGTFLILLRGRLFSIREDIAKMIEVI